MQRDLGDGMPLFMQMVKEHDGQIHFLYFWRAFSKAVRVVGGGEQGHGTHESLLADFETLRDRILRLLDMDRTKDSCTEEEEEDILPEQNSYCCSRGSSMPSNSVRQADGNSGAVREDTSIKALTVAEMKDLVYSTATMSSMPAFWNAAAIALDVHDNGRELLNLEDLTALMLQWIYNAVTWRPRKSSLKKAEQAIDAYVRANSPTAKRAAPHGPLAVRLHIYDVSHEGTVQQLNHVLANKDSPFKLGGAFHAGVEVNDLEWCFGYSGSRHKPGVACLMPKSHPQHHFRQTVFLGYTSLTPEDITVVISGLIEDYPGTDYDLLSRNCCHFADDFCQRLGVGRIPAWIHRFSFIGTHVANMMNAAHAIGSQIDGALQEVRGFHNRNFRPLSPPKWQPEPMTIMQI